MATEAARLEGKNPKQNCLDSNRPSHGRHVVFLMVFRCAGTVRRSGYILVDKKEFPDLVCVAESQTPMKGLLSSLYDPNFQ
jgi:hypothetical protein